MSLRIDSLSLMGLIVMLSYPRLNYHHPFRQMSNYFDATEEHSLISKLDQAFDAEVTLIHTKTATQADPDATDTKKLLGMMMDMFAKLVDAG
eukprot:scaffold31189_cov72-Cyclotella_meneghiniana.AAC.4